MGLLTETNEQYYAGQQAFIGTGGATSFTWTGDTTLVGTVSNVSFTNFTVTINNVLQTEVAAAPGAGQYNLSSDNTITFGLTPALSIYDNFT